MRDRSSLQEQAAKSAGMIAAFCERIGLPALDMLVSKFHGRVLHGVKEDLISLTSIRGVKGYTARLLYSAGLRSVEDVAKCEPDLIHAALVKGKRPDARGGEWRTARSISEAARRVNKVRLYFYQRIPGICMVDVSPTAQRRIAGSSARAVTHYKRLHLAGASRRGNGGARRCACAAPARRAQPGAG